jgi:hypothetical protein
MRCVACGVDMALVRAAPDNSMIPSGCEIGTYECPRCHSTALRRMPAPGLEPFADERMQLPAVSSALMVSAMRKLSLAKEKTMVTARSGVLRALTMLRVNRSEGT